MYSKDDNNNITIDEETIIDRFRKAFGEYWTNINGDLYGSNLKDTPIIVNREQVEQFLLSELKALKKLCIGEKKEHSCMDEECEWCGEQFCELCPGRKEYNQKRKELLDIFNKYGV